MKKIIDKAMELLNIEKHDAVEVAPHGTKYVPVSVVRCLAHEMLKELSVYKERDEKVLEHIEEARDVLISLGRL